MAYTYDPIFAQDPNNPNVVAANATITIYDPADAGKAPIAITDVSGSPLPNPITVNGRGMGPAFQHPTLDRVAWSGGGLSNYFTAYEGMKNEAVAARQAAESVAAQAAAGNFKGDKGDKGDTGAPGLNGSNVLPTAEAIAQAVTTDGPAKTALSATYGPPVSALQDFMGRAKTAVSDLNILIVSDSTGAAGGTEPASWARRLPAKIAPLFPAYSVEWVLWDGVGSVYGAPTVVQTGTGTKKIKVWLAAVAGQSWQYHWDTSRREAMLYAPKADLVMFSLGHNDNSTNAQAGTVELIREKPIVHIEQMRTLFPSASVVLMSQNPLLNFNVASENRANVFRRIAAQRGYGFIDVCAAFKADGRPLSDLILTSDGTHPTEAGYELWANTVLAAFRTSPGAQPMTAHAPAFFEPKKNWAPNGDLLSLDGANLPLTWTAQNTTVTKDTADFETGTYSLVLTKTAGGSTANVEVSLPLNLMKGQTVTVAVRLKVTGDAGLNAAGQIAGRIDVRDSKGIYASDIWNLPDQWVWRMRTHRYDPDVTYTRFRIATDPTTAASAQVKIDRVIAVLGEYPSDLL